MNETPELELVDLGDAMEETKAAFEGPLPEDDFPRPRRDF